MPQVSAAVLRSTPSSTSASASIRRAAALFFSPLAALRSSEAVRSSRVIDTAAPIDAAPLKGQHRVRVSLIWESPMSHSFGPLVLDLRSGELHRFAAAAGAGLVRIVEDELRRHLVDLVVHLGAEQKQHGLGIDQDLHALVLDDLVGGADIVGILDRI